MGLCLAPGPCCALTDLACQHNLMDPTTRPCAPPTTQASLSLTSADLQRQVELRKAHLAVKQRGVDICVMVDCTGSMVSRAHTGEAGSVCLCQAAMPSQGMQHAALLSLLVAAWVLACRWKAALQREAALGCACRPPWPCTGAGQVHRGGEAAGPGHHVPGAHHPPRRHHPPGEGTAALQAVNTT